MKIRLRDSKLTTFLSVLMQYFASYLSFKSNNNVHKYGVIQIFLKMMW